MKQDDSPGCPHCPGGVCLKYPLFEDEYFWTGCDAHPLVEGHIEIIPKEHISCMGALDDESFARYKALYEKVLNFLDKTYGEAGVFEHGVTGQTVFHAHTHFLPFSKTVGEIVPEKESLNTISKLDELQTEFGRKNKYLFFAVGSSKFLVDTKLGQPRFFRDRFAKSLDVEELGNWKKTETNPEMMKAFARDTQELKNRWDLFFK